MKKLAYFFIFTLLFSAGCKKDEENENGTVRVVTRALFNGEPVSSDELYDDGLGHKIRIEGFKAYLSNMALHTDDGESAQLVGVYLADPLSGDQWSVEIPSRQYTSLTFSTGVPPEVNKDTDPASYPIGHPLSVNGSAGMFWSWNTGYIFTKFEGKANLDGEDSPVLDPFAFHVGEDQFYRTHEQIFNICPGGEETKTIYIDFNVETFLNHPDDAIDIETDFLTHTSGNVELAERFNENYNKSIYARR